MPAVYDKDPDAVDDFVIDDWAELLAPRTPGDACDSITGHTIVVDPGITIVESSDTATEVTVRASGGTAGTTYQVTARVDTAQGRTDDRSIHIRVVER